MHQQSILGKLIDDDTKEKKLQEMKEKLNRKIMESKSKELEDTKAELDLIFELAQEQVLKKKTSESKIFPSVGGAG